jgi:hypothetical protein
MMKTWIGMMLALLLMFVGCAKQGEQSAPAETEKKAVESTKEAMPEEAAKAGDEDPDVASCLKLVSQAKFNDALPVCLTALKKHPANEEVKGAVEKAQAAVGDAAAAATEAAQAVQEDAGAKAQGAMDEATGSLGH